MKLRTKKQTIIITILELILLATAVYCIFNMVASKAAERYDEKESAAADLAERQADLGNWNLILVNKWNEVPEDQEVVTADIENGYSIDERIKSELEAMMADCRAAGCDPVICSAFRTNEQQQFLYEREAQPYLDQGMDEEEAYKKAGESVAVPGTSEHECGLAVDIIDEDYQVLDKKQEKTDTQKWLMEHCQDYGFILRYPNGRTETTGIIYEPWHYRYVGKNHAKVIMEEGICLEDYIEELKQS